MNKFFRGRMLGLVSLCLAGIISALGLLDARAHASEFCIADDAFSISNGPGYCFAMAAFSRWYYLTKQGEPPLRKAMDKGTQQRIARQLQEFYSRNLITLQADYCNQHQANQAQSFNAFVASVVSGDPRIVLLMNRGGDNGAILHAVLAYEWIPERRVVKVYDPNYINEERYIDIDSGRYTSLDITYNAICFPEVLNNHVALVQKMANLYAQVAGRRTASVQAWRGTVSRTIGPRSKAEAYSAGNTQ
jgi:hypothetical protein